MLKGEVIIYRLLRNKQGFPLLHAYGVEGDSFYIVLDYIGHNLHRIMELNNNKLIPFVVFRWAEQMVKRIEVLHELGYIHRDIKPENFLLNMDDMVYLIDFGLVKKYRKENKHIAFGTDKKLIGTSLFASLNAHLDYEQSRRDDLESLGYTLIYLLNGRLFWNTNNEVRKEEAANDRKAKYSVDVICKGMPSGIAAYLSYCRGLLFETDPDYNELTRILRKASTHLVDPLTNWRIFLASLINVDVHANLHESHNACFPGLIKRKECTKPCAVPKLNNDNKQKHRKSKISKVFPKKIQYDTKNQPSRKDIRVKKTEDNLCEGKGLILNIDEGEIPVEHLIKEEIKIPVCTYINNIIHWKANKKRKSVNGFRVVEGEKRYSTMYFIDATSESGSKFYGFISHKRNLSADNYTNKLKRTPSKTLI